MTDDDCISFPECGSTNSIKFRDECDQLDSTRRLGNHSQTAPPQGESAASDEAETCSATARVAKSCLP